jgi:hypothetical protein
MKPRRLQGKLWSAFGLLFADSDHIDEEPNPDLHQSEKSDPDPDPYQSENPDSNPDPQHCMIEFFPPMNGQTFLSLLYVGIFEDLPRHSITYPNLQCTYCTIVQK